MNNRDTTGSGHLVCCCAVRRGGKSQADCKESMQILAIPKAPDLHKVKSTVTWSAVVHLLTLLKFLRFRNQYCSGMI